MSIKIDVNALDARLDGGALWTNGWGDYKNPDGKTCLHGAIRFCQPIPGDAYLIERVGERYGFGTEVNDLARSWGEVREKVPTEVTDAMLADTFGPQWADVVAVVRRAATLTDEEAEQLATARATAGATAGVAARAAARATARDAGRAAAREAAWATVWDAGRATARDAGRATARDAARVAAQAAAWDAAWDAAQATAGVAAIGDLIEQHGFTREHYDTLMAPWVSVVGNIGVIA